eukprot:6203977-Pleurochrysis_carterae.AAC.2
MWRDDGACCDKPEKEVDTICCGAILVNHIELTAGECHLNAVSKIQIMDALEQQSSFACGKLPAAWKETMHKDPRGPRKKMARTC